MALEQLAKIKTTKKGDIKITSRAYKNGKKKSKKERQKKLAGLNRWRKEQGLKQIRVK